MEFVHTKMCSKKLTPASCASCPFAIPAVDNWPFREGVVDNIGNLTSHPAFVLLLIYVESTFYWFGGVRIGVPSPESRLDSSSLHQISSLPQLCDLGSCFWDNFDFPENASFEDWTLESDKRKWNFPYTFKTYKERINQYSIVALKHDH